MRRLAEGVAPNVFVPMAFLAAPVLFGLRTLYPWTDAATVAADHLLQAKEPWLNVPFFLGADGVLLRRLVGARDLVPPQVDGAGHDGRPAADQDDGNGEHGRARSCSRSPSRSSRSTT